MTKVDKNERREGNYENNESVIYLKQCKMDCFKNMKFSFNETSQVQPNW